MQIQHRCQRERNKYWPRGEAVRHQTILLRVRSFSGQTQRLFVGCVRCPSGWLISMLLAAMSGHIYADETPVFEDLQRRQAAERAYEQAIVRFNTNIQPFSSWEAFKGIVLSRLQRGASGRCYKLTGSSMEPITVTDVTFHQTFEGNWHVTSGNGWRQRHQDRTFIEYRYNSEADALLWIEGVNPRFFFASTQRLCEFFLSSPQGVAPSS